MAQSKTLALLNREERGFDLVSADRGSDNHRLRLFVFVTCVFFLLFADSATFADGTISTPARSRLIMTSEEAVWLETHRELRIGITTDWPPFEYLDEKGVYTGLAADYLRIAADELGLKITFDSTTLPWDKVLQRIRDKELDAVPAVSISDQRRTFINFTAPYIVIPNVVFIRKGSPQVSSLAELHGKKLACMQGWIVHDLLAREHPEIRLSPNDHIEGLLGQVLMGTVDAGIIDLATLSHYSKQHHLSDVTIAFRSPYSMNLGMGFRQDWPIMAGLFQKVFDGMTKEQAAFLHDKWISEPLGNAETLRLALRWLFFLVLLVIGAVLWNIQLRKLVSGRTAELEKEVEQNRRQAVALAESERKLRAIFNQTFQYIGLLSKDGRLLQANRPTIDLDGTAEENLIGHPFWDTPWWNRTPVVQERLKKAIEHAATGGFDRFESTHVSPVDGIVRHIDFSIKPFTDETGSVHYLIAEGRDVTEQHQAREARDKMEEQFLQSQKMESIGRLAGGIAHDFNNILTVINGFAELALYEPGLPVNLRATLQEIANAGKTATDLTHQLLAFSHRQPTEPRIIDLNESLGNLKQMLSRIIGENISLEINTAQDLSRVRADPSQIEQILVNLVVNAKDAMPDGGTLLVRTANVELQGIGKYVQFEVIDTGTGMTEEVRKKIFEPFFTTKPKHEGTGLGLATVYGIVRQNGGRIEVESSPGKGSRFRIQLPEVAGPVNVEKEAQKPMIVSGNGELVLVVEDEPMIRDLILQGLPVFGFRVQAFENGREALGWFETSKEMPAILVTDVVMPEMSGRELADQVQKNHPGLPTLFTSGYAESVVAHNGVVDSDIHFLMKPYMIQSLVMKIAGIIARKKPSSAQAAPGTTTAQP